MIGDVKNSFPLASQVIGEILMTSRKSPITN